MDGTCSAVGVVGRGVYTVLVGKAEGKRQLERPRRRWENIIKANLQEVRFGVMDWIELTKDSQVAGNCGFGNKLSDFIKCWEFLD
jgi:hypothetical protein